MATRRRPFCCCSLSVPTLCLFHTFMLFMSRRPSRTILQRHSFFSGLFGLDGTLQISPVAGARHFFRYSLKAELLQRHSIFLGRLFVAFFAFFRLSVPPLCSVVTFHRFRSLAVACEFRPCLFLALLFLFLFFFGSVARARDFAETLDFFGPV